MESAGGYDLKWKDHLREVFGVVRKLRSRDAFSDVIVHCAGTNFSAHKVLLAASSAFFERVLDGIPAEKSKVLVMTDIKPSILELVMDFIYNGEAYVEADVFSDFMETAEKLEIRGLRQEANDEAASRDPERSAVSTGRDLKRPAPPESSSVEPNLLIDSRDSEGPVVKRTKQTPALAKVKNWSANFSIEKASSSSSAAFKAPSVDPSTSDVKPVLKGEANQPSTSGVSKGSHGPPRTSKVDDDDEVVELQEDGTVKTEREEEYGHYGDYANDGAEGDEWGEESTYGEGGYDEGQYDENFAGGEGEGETVAIPDQPLKIPPEISPETVQTWEKVPGVWHGLIQGQKTYFCGICGYTSPKSTNVQRHVPSHSSRKPCESPSVCPFCGRRFARRAHLKYHTIKVHRVQLEC